MLDILAAMRHLWGMSFQRHLCLAALLVGLSNCTYLEQKFGGMMPSFSKKTDGDKKIGEAKVIGVIELVNPEQNYVLINCEQRVDIPAGTEIISQGVNGSDARLKVTPERKGNYITADITQGMPQLKDLVVYQVKPGESQLGQQQPPPLVPTAGGGMVPMAPTMRADVIPPLNAPFQPIGPMRSTVEPPANLPKPPPPPQEQPPPRQVQKAPAPPPAEEPKADLSKLLPVVR